jgi:hypothetical protein
MAQASLSEEAMLEAIRLVDEYGSIRGAARAKGIPRQTLQNRYHSAKDAGLSQPVPIADDLPPDDIPTEEIIGLMKRRFAIRREHVKAKRWREFHVPTAGPYALMLFGDPHVDDDGCNWALLEDHCELARKTKHLYAISIGDVHNNWVGRLEKLYANQETSKKTAHKLVKWLIQGSGVPWWLWVHGNHDAWNGGIALIEEMNINRVVMEDWEAKVTLVSPNGHNLRLWLAHNFPGTSQWNKLHGPQKAAQMKDWAHLYAAGHHHNWALHQEEHDQRGFVYWLARLRGYKFMDDYADKLGFGEQEYGSSMIAVIDPASDKLNSLTCFADPHEGVDFLEFKRRKA